jgi:hypothetical protein
VGNQKEDFKDNSEQGRARFSKGANPLREEASFEQLLGQLDIQNSRPAAEGSVTRLFSLVNDSAESNSAAAVQPDAGRQESQPPAVPGMNASESKSREVPAIPPTQQEPRNEAPGDFTRIFTKLPTPRTAQPAILSELPAVNPPAPSSSSGGDSFTQFFQTVEPARASSVDSGRSSRLSPATEPPAKGTPTPAETYQAPPSSAFSDPVRSQPTSGGFTELLNSLGSDRASNSSNAPVDAMKSSFASPARRSDETRAFGDRSFAQSSASFASSSAPDTAPRPGEFTQLLQSLQRPSEPRPGGNPTPTPSLPAQAPSSERNAAENNPTPEASSDFTRVMKSAAARSNSEAAPSQPSSSPAVPPQQNSAAARGAVNVLQAVPHMTPAALPAIAARTLLERLAPWLLVMNGVLLVLLTVLVSLFLLHQHH